ncbi:Gfo/Idh/MocA family protein [Paenibacillus methanolicus]|uniref:Putative dehydrogenase n=1 Tax=Paenibacillus methanolicus TaxID=582686 RepID=A0A5S5CAF2_9BACL|nr:Gfo/Idh/MocA family oxidoreductase [Paenibacillus methanolicus]TYP76381.1 putative dehydrogenase [Paenibacillus methanolicus]
MNEPTLRIGMIGLDTSHAIAFAELLHDGQHAYHVPGGRITAAYPGGSSDFELSYSRVGGFTDRLRDQYDVDIADSPEAVAEACDAILLTSVDGRVHPEQFRRIAGFRKPVFVDKPLAVTSADAEAILSLARQYGTPVMSCSALRFAEGLSEALRDEAAGRIIGMDSYGPMAQQPTQPGLFWYGVHLADMLFRSLGPDCVQVSAVSNDAHDLIVGEWANGAIGTMRGNRMGNDRFGVMLHRENDTRSVDVYAHPKPYYASMLEQIMGMFRTGVPAVALEETVRIMRFLEAANESRATGRAIRVKAHIAE